MKLVGLSRAAVLASLILSLSAYAASGKNGRDFAGFYTVSNVVDQGNQTMLTLRVQLFNQSDADVKQATLTLRESPGSEIGAFQPLKLWRNHGEVRLAQQFVIPKREFEKWRKGSQPALMVVYHDAQGQRFDRFVQMSKRPALPR
jgi:hypothetical protein